MFTTSQDMRLWGPFGGLSSLCKRFPGVLNKTASETVKEPCSSLCDWLPEYLYVQCWTQVSNSVQKIGTMEVVQIGANASYPVLPRMGCASREQVLQCLPDFCKTFNLFAAKFSPKFTLSMYVFEKDVNLGFTPKSSSKGVAIVVW